MSNNPVVRWQIISPTPQKQTEFYSKLFNWEASTDNMLNYTMLDTGSERGIHGGVWPAPPEVSSFVQLFIEVEDCANYVQQAVALGATVLIPPQALPDGDTMAILKDPCGMSFGIMKPAPI
jgi:predicted enzyme related to lactoylglutathione lyase